MTSLLPQSTRPGRRPASEVAGDLATRRPLVLLATAGGAAAAASTLVVCMALGLVGWFLTDGGAHGTPRDGLRVGALGWLVAHRSGVRIEGAPVTAVPLGVTLVIAWTIWRVGLRVGSSISGHGPDAEALADGDRDWTVPVATTLFTLGYVVTAVVTAAVVGGADTAPSTTRVVLWSVLLCVVLGGTALAVGSGRAAIWTAFLPLTARVVARIARRIVVLWLALGLVVLLVSLAVDLSTAANVMSQLHADAGGATMVVALCVVLLPNAVLFSGSYLLGPGFAVGTGTAVTSSAVVLGPLPIFPLLAALPDQGPAPGWTSCLLALPPLVALVSVVLVLRAFPTTRWEEGAVRGCAGGVMAGIGFGLLAHLAGGSVGPGRMQDVAPFVAQVVLHAVTSFGLGGLVGGLLMTWWQRRSMPVTVTLE